jgi:heterogeneous nuclear ribonucleoprotein L
MDYSLLPTPGDNRPGNRAMGGHPHPAHPAGRGERHPPQAGGGAPYGYGGGDNNGYNRPGQGNVPTEYYRSEYPDMGYQNHEHHMADDAPCVVMLHGLDQDKFDCNKVFNLLCIYGNVNKVKFLKTKAGSVMVEMAGRDAVNRIFDSLKKIEIFGCKLDISTSRQTELYEGNNTAELLPSGEPYFKNFMGSRDQRFTTPDQRAKNRPQIPGEVLHVFNVPKEANEEQVRMVFTESGCGDKIKKISLLEAKNETAGRIAGSVHFESSEDALSALVLANYAKIKEPSSGKVVPIKLCFAQPERERRT